MFDQDFLLEKIGSKAESVKVSVIKNQLLVLSIYLNKYNKNKLLEKQKLELTKYKLLFKN